MNLYVIANSVVSPESMSGGDKIFIELGKRWGKRGYTIHLLACPEGKEMGERNNLQAIYYQVNSFRIARCGVIGGYVLRILWALFSPPLLPSSGILYSSSDFLPDTILAWRLRKVQPDFKWIAGIYLIAPYPWKNLFSPILFFRSIIYFLTQRFCIILMRKYADMVFVLNQQDKKFLERKKILSKNIKIISGGVDLDYISKIKGMEDLYDGCFIGRFHPQKGIIDLIRIWEIVCKKRDSKLAIIGWGPPRWTELIKKEISWRGIQKNIDILGFLDGDKKFSILKSSKVFLFPSVYESWGLVAIEAMACGLPVVAYDLPVFQDIFPTGMKKVSSGKVEEFAQIVIEFLENKELWGKWSKDAFDLAYQYDWSNITEKTIQWLEESVR